MNNIGIINEKRINKSEWLTANNAYLFIMYAFAFAVISNSSLAIITGPIIAMVMTRLFFTDKYYCVVALVVFANDSLGTVALGRVSFYWLLIGLFLIRFLSRKKAIKISVKGLIYFSIVLLILLQLMITNNIAFLFIFQTLSFVVFLLLTWANIKNDGEKVKDFFFNVALTIFIIALSTVAFGGVVFMDGYTDRLGISGVGIGDPNFSSLIINAGIAILLAQNYRNMIIRSGMILVMIAAMVQTASITGILVLLILLLCYFLVGLKLSKSVRNVFIVFLLVVMTTQYYNSLPLNSRNASVDLYISRIEYKLNAFNNKDYQAVTTNRSSNTEKNLKYYSNQSIGKQLLGGNSIPPAGLPLSHNTYADILLRFGLLGTIVLGFIMIKKLWKSFKLYHKTKENGEVFLLKVVFILFSSTLSIYSGNTFALWYMLLLVI